MLFTYGITCQDQTQDSLQLKFSLVPKLQLMNLYHVCMFGDALPMFLIQNYKMARNYQSGSRAHDLECILGCHQAIPVLFPEFSIFLLVMSAHSITLFVMIIFQVSQLTPQLLTILHLSAGPNSLKQAMKCIWMYLKKVITINFPP